MENGIHFNYRKNILISRFYERFSSFSSNLCHFRNAVKFLEYEQVIYHMIWIYSLLCDTFRFRATRDFAKFLKVLIFS